jgi:5S rRNA maturation endonuclease (ribonuclease M5)
MSIDNYAFSEPHAIDFLRIRQANPLVAYCEDQGIELRRSSNRWIGRCPLHNEQNGTAFVIHPDEKWQCFGKCSRQGDVVDLEMLLHGGTLAEAAERLHPGSRNREPIGTVRFPVSRTFTQPRFPTKENPLALPYLLTDAERQDCQRFSVRLLEDAEYIERISTHRQWKTETIRTLALDGYLGRDDDGHVCFNSAAGCKSRWRQDGERRFKFLFGRSWLWRGELIPQAQTVYLCEGETDAITLIDCGMEEDGSTVVVGLQGATLNIEPWSFLFAGKDVIISTDYDEAGRKAAAKIETALCDVALSISHLQIAEEVSSEQV